MKEFYNNSEGYCRDLEKLEHGFYHDYLDLIKTYVPNGSKVLDVGCGIGKTTSFIAGEGYFVVGTDISKKFVDHANKNYGINNLSFQVQDAEKITFPDESFDCVGSNNFIEHVTNVEAVLNEMIRLVKPGGHIIISSPNLISIIPPLKVFIKSQTNSNEILSPLEGGNNRIDALKMFVVNSLQYARKNLSKTYQFLYRDPVLENSYGLYGGDLDASYISNPTDLRKFFSQKDGFRVLKTTGTPPKESLPYMVLNLIAPESFLQINFCAQKVNKS